MTEKLNRKNSILWVYLITCCIIIISCIFIAGEFWAGLGFPFLLIIAYLYFYKLNILLLLTSFLTPLALNIKDFALAFNIRDFDIGFGMSVPTEPILFAILIFFFLKILWDRSFDKKIIIHPLTIFIIIQLAWMLVTCFTSQMPFVSFKAFLARLWFVVPFYYLVIFLFRKIQNIRLFICLYVISLLGVVANTIYKHSLFEYTEITSHWVMNPFYNDHTSYGAILALFIPVLFGFTFSKTYSKTIRFFSFLVLAVLVLALILSFSRAAWISLAFAFIVFLIILLKIKTKWIVLSLVAFVGIALLFQNEIWERLKKNKQNSSANITEHIQSIPNISTDNSNMERINRWKSAIRMFKERPIFGFGPGTYQFEYAPYQRPEEKTLISTNAGDKGNAHSEYIGPLAESGIIGMLSMVAILIAIITTGIRVYRKAIIMEVKVLGISITLGLITYFFHGLLNNFLDTDKASVPFWGFIATLVAFDLFYIKKQTETEHKP